jgi:hypothetical protein
VLLGGSQPRAIDPVLDGFYPEKLGSLARDGNWADSLKWIEPSPLYSKFPFYDFLGHFADNK